MPRTPGAAAPECRKSKGNLRKALSVRPGPRQERRRAASLPGLMVSPAQPGPGPAAFTTSGGRGGRAPRVPRNRATPWRATEEASAFPLEGGRPRPPKMKACLARRRGGRRGIACLSPGLDIILGRWMFLVGYWIFNSSFRGEPYRAAGTAALPGGCEIAPRRGALQKRQARSHWRADGPGRRLLPISIPSAISMPHPPTQNSKSKPKNS